MLGVSVSRETLTPNAGYVISILLRPAAGRQASCASHAGLGQADSAPVREVCRRQGASGYWAS